MFDVKSINDRLVDLEEPPHALVNGNELIAVVFEQRYLELFGQALPMLELVNRMAADVCETYVDGSHAEECKACSAKLILASLSDAPRIH